ncbi:MAG: phosphatidate cytidylyltransferase [Deltaproteobacteria bacterium]|nr:phosphatidate cytidylyltransferase [Deltaproteobacteria bacterium]
MREITGRLIVGSVLVGIVGVLSVMWFSLDSFTNRLIFASTVCLVLFAGIWSELIQHGISISVGFCITFAILLVLTMIPKIFTVLVVLVFLTGFFIGNIKVCLINVFAYSVLGLYSFWESLFKCSTNSGYCQSIGLVLVGAIVFDSFSYFVGSKFGKTPIAPKISPKKTIEGFVGGLIGYSLALGLLDLLEDQFVIRVELFCFPLFYFLGDLLKSRIKRMLGIKDFSSFFGFHGGFLDRLDSHLAGFIFLSLISD